MRVNENVFGAVRSWLNAINLSTGAMKCKCANFTGGNTVVSSSSLGIGNTAGKTPHNTLIDRSISTTALGTESIYSHILYWADSNTMYTDNEIATEFFYCTNDNSAPISNTSETIYTNSANNFWKTYNATNNKSDILVPITEINPKKILYLLQVMPVNANGGPAPFISGVVDNYRFMSIVDYANNARNIRTDYPYIQAARLVPCVDNSNTTTPSRSALSGGDYEFGMAINREFTAIPDDNLKINYCQFINIYDKFNIPLWGHRGYFNQSADYNVILANSDDIQTGVIEYSREYWIAHEWNEEFYDYLVRQSACFGVFVRAFSGGGSNASIPLTHDSIILGLLDEQGIGHGDYTRGSDNETNPIFNWNSYSESPYDYTKPIDPTPYNERTVFGDNTLSNTFIQYYAMNRTMLNILCSQIYNYINSVDTNVEDIYKAVVKEFYTNNPLDVIVSLKMFPFDIDNYIAGDVRLVKLGHLQTTAAGKKLNGSYNVVDLGSYQCFPKFGNTFLDYSPFTYYELIVPFCGTIRLDPAQFMDKTLRLKMAIDLYTGACTCYILADNLCIDSISGNCAVDMAITGIQSADFQNSIQNAITNVKNARLSQMNWNARGNLAMGAIWRGNLGVNVGSGHETSKFAGLGNVLADLGGSLNPLSFGSTVLGSQQREAELFMNVNKAEYDLQHITTPFASVGSQSAANCRMEEMKARLIIYRPIIAPDFDPQIYADSYGYATLENDVLSKYSGFTVAKINTEGLRCSEEERQMIENMFSNGVYL